jgi:IS5 family transposase
MYLRMMFLRFRYQLGFETLCAEVTDSIAWRRFCRIPLDAAVPHPTMLIRTTSRCALTLIYALNEALLAKAAEAKLVRVDKVRADTTVVEANVAYPTNSGLLAKRGRRSRRPGHSRQGGRARPSDTVLGPSPVGATAGARGGGVAVSA